jgi:hypothetical protein
LGFDVGQLTTGGAVGPGIAQRQQPLMGFVAADLSLRIAHPPLQDLAPIVDHPGPPSRRRQTGIAVIDGFLHRVVRTTAQLCCGAIGPGQVIGIEYFHDFSVRLQVVSPGDIDSTRHRHRSRRRGRHGAGAPSGMR